MSVDLGRVVEVLDDAVGPEEALDAMVAELLAQDLADTAAVVLKEGGSLRVLAARHKSGARLEAAAALVSERVILDALNAQRSVHVPDIAAHQTYASQTSIVTHQLRSVACIPMLGPGGAVGVLFLAGRASRAPIDSHALARLEGLAAMSVSLLARLRHAPRRPHLESVVDSLLLGEADAMVELRALVMRIGPSDLSVLVTGETGTGKDVVAQALHAVSPMREKSLVALNCAAVPESLLAAELFGAKKGAYTGATSDRRGRLEMAHQSTLFLDEVGDMPLPMQALLLRALEEKKVTRLGDENARDASFRLIAATHKDLDAEVSAGRFRQDLLFRLREMHLAVSPLRERPGDAALLGMHFLRETRHNYGLTPSRFSKASEERLETYAWPGNVRELKAAVRRAAVLCDADAIAPEHLRLTAQHVSAFPDSADEALSTATLQKAKEAFCRSFVQQAVKQHGSRELAADALGVSIRSIYRYLS